MIKQTFCDICSELDIKQLANNKCSICKKDVCDDHLNHKIINPVNHKIINPVVRNSMLSTHNPVLCDIYNVTCINSIKLSVCSNCSKNSANNIIYEAQYKEIQIHIHKKYMTKLNEILN